MKSCFGNEIKHSEAEQGFTLVELAIVLVIIGLIIGGVLVGQDMIKAAEIRSTIGQVEKYNAASNTFQDKYGYIPGDFNSTRAGEFGYTARSGAAGHGDGNSLIEGCSAGAIVFGCENALFWVDLSQASMVDGSFTTATDALGNGGAAIAAAAMGDFMPESRMRKGNFFTVFSANGRNWFQLTNITAITAAGVYTLNDMISPQEAFQIDTKMDDGKPLTGVVRAMGGTGPLNVAATAAAPATGVCASNASGNPYATTTEAIANDLSCQLRFRLN